jgi:hypothetical protein
LAVFAGFRRKLIHELKAAEGKREWGLFIDSCFTHCQTQWSGSWNSPTSPRLGNKVGSKSLNCRVYTAVAKQVPWPHIFSTFFLGADDCRGCWSLVLWEKERGETDRLQVSMQPHMWSLVLSWPPL